MKEPVLCIGGPMDGKYVEVEPGQGSFIWPEPPPRTVQYKRRDIHLANGEVLKYFSPHEHGETENSAFYLAVKRMFLHYSRKDTDTSDEHERESNLLLRMLVSECKKLKRERDMLQDAVKNLFTSLSQEGEFLCPTPKNPTTQAGSD